MAKYFLNSHLKFIFWEGHQNLTKSPNFIWMYPKLWQNKKDKIFVWAALKMVSFSQLPAVKKTPFFEQLKQMLTFLFCWSSITLVVKKKKIWSLQLCSFCFTLCIMINMGCRVFNRGGTKLERFPPKNQHTHIDFENWFNGELSKIGLHFSNKVI